MRSKCTFGYFDGQARNVLFVTSGSKKMPEDDLALEMNNLDVLGYLNHFSNNSAVTVYLDRFECRVKWHQV